MRRAAICGSDGHVERDPATRLARLDYVATGLLVCLAVVATPARSAGPSADYELAPEMPVLDLRGDPGSRAHRSMPGAGSGRAVETAGAYRALDAADQRDVDIAGVGDAARGTHRRIGGRHQAIADVDRDVGTIAAGRIRRGDLHIPLAIEAGSRGLCSEGDRKQHQDARGDRQLAKVSHGSTPLCF